MSLPPPTHTAPRRSRSVVCAECRRLKLKCDREFPCLNCRRREVASLCPDGSLITRSRLTSAAISEVTHFKQDMMWMSERIKKLEEALAVVQSKVSNDPHPLLLIPPPERLAQLKQTKQSGAPRDREPAPAAKHDTHSSQGSVEGRVETP